MFDFGMAENRALGLQITRRTTTLWTQEMPQGYHSNA